MILQSLVSAVGTVVLLELGHGVIAVAALNLGVALAQFVIKVGVVRGRYAVRFARRHIDRRVLPGVLAFASWVFVINVASKVIFDTDTIVVGALLGPAAVAIYQVALSPTSCCASWRAVQRRRAHRILLAARAGPGRRGPPALPRSRRG